MKKMGHTERIGVVTRKPAWTHMPKQKIPNNNKFYKTNLLI